MPIPLIAIFSCGVGVPPAPEFDEKECDQEVYCIVLMPGNQLSNPLLISPKVSTGNLN